MKKARLGKTGIEILKLLGTGVALVFILSSPQGTRRLLKGIKRELKIRRAHQTLDRLQRRKLISYRIVGAKIIIELTDAGNKMIREYETENISPKIPKKWDSKWRIIFSDISESNKKGRDALRAKFKNWGFYPLQKSVFVYPYDCEDEIAIMRDMFHIPNNDLLIVTAPQVGDTKKLKKYFNLK